MYIIITWFPWMVLQRADRLAWGQINGMNEQRPCACLCGDCLCFSVCYQPSSALVQAQPLDRSLIIWISSITATSSKNTQTRHRLVNEYTQTKFPPVPPFLLSWDWNETAVDHSSLVQLMQFHVKHSDIVTLMLLSRNVCMRYVNLQGVLTLHISMVQATWPDARPSGSVNVLSSPVTKSHLTPCEYAHTYTHGTSVNTAVWRVGDRRWRL